MFKNFLAKFQRTDPNANISGVERTTYDYTGEIDNSNWAKLARSKSVFPPKVSVYGWGAFPYLDNLGSLEPTVSTVGPTITTISGNVGGAPIPKSQGNQPLFNPDYIQLAQNFGAVQQGIGA